MKVREAVRVDLLEDKDGNSLDIIELPDGEQY